MNESENNNYVNYNNTWSLPGGQTAIPPEVPSAPGPEEPLTWRDAAAPALALGLSLLFWAVFSLDSVLRSYGPGLGVPVFVAAFYGAVLLLLGRRARREGILPMAASMLLAVCCALYAHMGFTILNCFIILILSAVATFAFAGQSRFPLSDIRKLPEAVRLSVTALFTRIDRPFRAAGRAAKGGSARLIRIGLTVLVTAALLAVVLALLALADMVFGSFFERLRDALQAMDAGELLWKLVRALGLTLFIASGLYFIREKLPSPAERSAGKRLPAAPFLLPVLALDVVYAVFCAVQVRYLFGGAEAAAMAGGWAEYARTGFFQLAAVAGLNLLLCLLATEEERFASKGGHVLRLGCALMLVLTLVILASAAYRMGLYIAAFGLSVLRLSTLWAMVVILAGLLAAGWKLCRPCFRFWPVFFAFALGTWCLLCLANPAGRAADFNADAYLSGRLPEADVCYLETLGPDAAPALTRLAETEEYAVEASSALQALSRQAGEASWTGWKLSFRHLG